MRRGRPTRAVVLTDTDSYVKWGAALASQFPAAWDVELLIARSSAVPSPRQIADGLAGTRFAGTVPRIVGLADLRRMLGAEGPDVVLLAARGYTVQAAVSVLPNVPTRPVIVTGLPGVGVPVLPYGLGFRRSADVFVVHSRREVREFTHAAQRLGHQPRFELATLPYLRHQVDEPAQRDGRIVFAAQALVPATRRERVWLVERLADVARAHPTRPVVVKIRALPGETQTHHEQVSFQTLVEELADRPDNLVVEAGPMQDQLARAGGFVTVSSTALLEAIAAGVPAMALEDFGVGVSQINLALEGSGLIGDTNDLVALKFAEPQQRWLVDNYFHDPAEDTWLDRVHDLLAQRSEGRLDPYPSMPGAWRNGFRNMLYRNFSFVDGSEHGPVRSAAERAVVGSALWLTQRRSWLMRTFWPSPHGAKAREFARQNSASAPLADADHAS